jgi:hypothetical protein
MPNPTKNDDGWSATQVEDAFLNIGMLTPPALISLELMTRRKELAGAMHKS